MSKKSILKQIINSKIRKNDHEEISGEVLNAVLNKTVDAIPEETGVQGFLKIDDSIPTIGKYELPDIGIYENLIPIIHFGETEPSSTPITTEKGFYNAVYWDGVNFTQSKAELPKLVTDEDLDENSENAIQNKPVSKELKKVNKKFDSNFATTENGELVVRDEFGNIGLKLDSNAILHLLGLKIYTQNGDLLFVDEQNNIGLKLDKFGKLYADFADESFQKLFNKITKKEFEIDFPNYVFGTNSASGEPREYFTEVYPEALTSEKLAIEIDGNKKLILQAFDRTTGASESLSRNIKIGGNGYEEKLITVNYVRASRLNGQNEKIFILGLGDSILEQDTNFFDGTGGSWINFIKQFALMDNKDVGNISIKTVGTINTINRSFDYAGENLISNTKSEGRAGWATYNYLNYPKWSRIDGTAFETSNAFIGGEAMYYLAGLATKTPFDSSTAGQAFTAYNSSNNETVAKTPVGRFKPDITEVLWSELKNKWGYVSAFSTYAGNVMAIRNEIYLFLFGAGGINNCNGGICFNPDNPFFSIAKGQAYTGSHVWTNQNAFSKTIYLSRYRTMDDNGNRLSLGNPSLGTKVTNPADYDICTPTHVITGLGTNDFSLTPEISTSLAKQIWDEFSSVAKVGVFVPRRPGVFFPNKWQDYGLQIEKNNASFPHIQNKLYKTEIGALDASNITYIPSFFTQSPISAAFSDRYAYDLDGLNGEKKVISGSDGVHLSAYALRSIAYQCISWIYYTLK